MFWVVQDDLFQENGRQALIDTLDRFDIPYQVVQIVPFEHRLIPEVTHTGPIITNGSVLLSKIALKRGWHPGGFLNANFDYQVWYPHFKDYLLNRDAIFITVEAAYPLGDDTFVRPVADDKSFNGQVMTREELIEWKAKVMQGNEAIKPDTLIILAHPKKVGQEYRHFIIDGKVITSSRYKLNGRLNQSEECDEYIVQFANRMASLYQPARAFVLDTYITGDEVGIVELGCLCNAGFYKADVQKLVMTLDRLEV